MSSILAPAIPAYRNPEYRRGLVALAVFLTERNYSSHAIGRAFDFVAVNGTLEGSIIEPSDMAAAESAFVDALPEMPFDAEAWDRPDTFLDRVRLLTGDHPLPFGLEPEVLAPTFKAPEEWAPLPPIAGGGFGDEPTFEPSPEDLDWWAAQCGARGATRRYLDGFNAVRQPWTEVPA